MNIKKLFGKKKDEEKLKAFQQAAGYSGSATTQPAAERQLTSDITLPLPNARFPTFFPPTRGNGASAALGRWRMPCWI